MKALIKNKFLTSIFICLLTFISLFSLIACNDTKLEQKQDYDMSGITFEDKTVTYDGNEHALTISGTLPEGVTVTYENNKLTEVGSVKATAKFSHNNPNYNEIPNMTATLTVEEASLKDITGISLEDKTYTYDGKVKSLTITGKLPEGVTVTYENNENINAGTYEVTAILKGNGYNTLTLKATLTITKASYDMSGITFEDKTVTYDGNEHELTISGTLPEGVTVGYTNNKLTEVGNIDVIAVFSHNNPNYNEISNMTATLTVEENPLYHTVKFIISDNEFKEVLVKEGEGVKLEDIPNIPSKTGYNGVWDKDISCITKDIEVYVKYIPKEYTITYIPNGGEIESLTQKVVYDQAFTLYEITRKGHTFLGYKYNDNMFESGIWNIDEDITIEAKWEVNTYRISYMLNSEVIYYEDVLFGENYTLYEYITEEYDVVAWINNGNEVSPNVKTTLNEDNDIVYVGKCGYVSDDFNYSISNNKAEITGYNGNDLYVRIPDYIKDNKIYYQVTSIGDYAFRNCSSPESITIPEGVTSIGYSAFEDCDFLESVYITNIEAWLSIDFSDFLSNPLFYACDLYLNNELVTDLVIPEGITSIGNYAFAWCSSLESITIPNSVTSIGGSAFYYCSSLESVTISKGVTSIEEAAFYNCSSLKSVTIPNSVTSIGSSAFSGCRSLISVTIPDSVTSIGNYAFNGCSSLESVYITNIESWLLINFGNEFSNPLCRDANLYLNNELVTDLVIPEGITSIGDSAFSGYSSLTSVTIPDSVTSIGNYAFSGCSSLKDVYITNIEVWASIKFDVYSSNPLCNGANLYLNNELVTDLVLPEGITSIKNYAFEGCSSLISITILEGVTSIGDSAFSNCSSLESIIIPNSVTSIRDYAFRDCSSLISITIPNSLRSIGHFAFSGCSSLESIKIPNSVRIIGNGAFEGCSSLISVTIPEGVTSIRNYAFSNCSILESITIPNSVTNIGISAFEGCESLENITIPNSVTSIGISAFDGCSKLNHIYYKGTADEWNNINGSSDISNGTIYYYSETKPTTSGNYWHYDVDGITPVIWNKY